MEQAGSRGTPSSHRRFSSPACAALWSDALSANILAVQDIQVTLGRRGRPDEQGQTKHTPTISKSFYTSLQLGWLEVGICGCSLAHFGVDTGWSLLQVFRYLAACHQHGNDHHHIPDGVSHSEHAKPGCTGHPLKAG